MHKVNRKHSLETSASVTSKMACSDDVIQWRTNTLSKSVSAESSVTPLKLPTCTAKDSKEVKTFQVSPFSSSIWEQAQCIAKSIPVVRILVAEGNISCGFGQQNTAIDTLRCWLALHRPKKVELIIGCNDPSMVSILIPNYNPDKHHENQSVDFYGFRCSLIPKEQHPILEQINIAVVAGRTQKAGDRELMRARTILYIQPHKYLDSEGWLVGGELKRYKDINRLNLPNPTSSIAASDIVSYMPSPKFSSLDSNLITLLSDKCTNHEIDLAVGYGFHCHFYVENLVNQMQNIGCALFSLSKRRGKPNVLLVFSEFASNNKKREVMQITWKDNIIIEQESEHCIHFLEDSADNRKEKTLIILFGRAPKPVFEHMVLSSNLPVFFEGANTLQMINNFGKSHISINFKTTALEDIPEFTSASYRRLRISNLLNSPLAQLVETSQHWKKHKNSLKPAISEVFDCLRNNWSSSYGDDHYVEYETLITHSLQHIDYKTRMTIQDIILSYYISGPPTRSYPCNFQLEFLAEFFSGTTSQKGMGLVADLIEYEEIENFCRFINELTQRELVSYFEESLTSGSELQALSTYLQEQSQKPENNKLVQLLCKLPQFENYTL